MRFWGVFRVVVIGIWLVAAALALWTAPRESTYARASADLTAGRVTTYRWGDSWSGSDRLPWFSPAEVESSGPLGPLFVWTTGDGRVHWVDTDTFDEVNLTGAVDRTAYSGAGAAALAQDLDTETAGFTPPGAPAGWLGLALALTFLTVLAGGPAPVLGTRWFWLWLVLLTPYGLGLVFWLLRDRPGARAEAGGAPDRGILGVGLGLAAAILISLLVHLVW